ncbi:MAG TPA: hypothetical protein VK563_08040 [Puia sp.]|nr:hypothetical protein [Puia sp.]
MRNIILTLAPMLLSGMISAQGVFSNKTQSVLEKVIQDYPNRFYNIKGEQIQQTRQITEFRSTVQLPGSSTSVITLVNGSRNEDYTWTCAEAETQGFGKAKARFHEIFTQISNSIITTSGQKTYILTGQYEEPAEDKNLTRIVFSLLPGVGQEKKLKVELSLREESKQWKISLSVYDSDQKNGQGAITAN